MRKGWRNASVGELLQLEYGKPLEEKDRKQSGRFPVYGANGEKDRTDKFYYDRPSIVVGRKGSAGEINLTERKFWPLDVTYFVTFDEGQHDLRFLYYLLTTLALPTLAKGVKPGINRNDVYALPTSVPLLAEQQRIVAKLDEAIVAVDFAQSNAESNLHNAREIFDSHLNSVFAERGRRWRKKQLRDFCEFENGDRGANYPNKSARSATGIPFINAGHLTNDGLEMETMDFISEERFELLGAGKVRPGDVLFCLRGSLGKFASVGKLNKGAIASSLVIVRPQSTILTGFLLAYFRSSLCGEMVNRYKNGAAQPNLSANSLSQFLIPVPTISEQESIIDELDNLRAETRQLETIYQKKLTELNALKTSLLHQAFCGAL